MKRFISITFALCLSLLLVACGSKFSNAPRALNKASQSVVKIVIYNIQNEEIASGSGFFAFDSQTIITNYHVIEGAYNIEIIDDNDNKSEIATVYNVDQNKDIAILRLKNKSNTYVPLKLYTSNNLKRGEKVVAIGSPLGIKNSISEGTISNFVEQDSMEMIQFTAAISSGSSGGALFNDSGQVIGITSASYVEGQNLNLAVPSSQIINLYKKQPISKTVLEYYKDNIVPTITPGILTIAVTVDSPPYEYIDQNGEYAGIQIEMLEAIAEQLGLQTSFVNIPSSFQLDNMLKGNVDCYIKHKELIPFSHGIATNNYSSALFTSNSYLPSVYTNNEDLIISINKAISTCKSNGTFNAILSKYGVE